MNTRRCALLAASGVASLVLTGCALGPNFQPSALPIANRYTRQPITKTARVNAPVAGGMQTLSSATHVDAEWWLRFRSPTLNALVAAALRNNSDLDAARSALRAARESWLASRSVMLPTVDAGASTSRAKGSQFLAPTLANNSFDYNLQTADISVGFTPDLFGGNRRLIEQARAQYDAQAFEAEATRLTLIDNVIATAFTEAALARQVAAQKVIITAQVQQLAIMQRQQHLGEIAVADVLVQTAALAGARAALPPLAKQWAQAQDALAILTGRTPAEGTGAEVDLTQVTLPADLPLSLPADLVKQRPDVRAAAENLHAASAAVGVAMAARLPSITLSASAGGSASNWSPILSAANSLWSLGAGVAQPVFEGGRLLHNQKAAEAQLEQAKKLYRSAVLTAFQNVANTLHALQLDADALSAAESARTSAESSLKIAQRQSSDGETSFLTVLAAEETQQQAEQAALVAEAQRLTDTAALYQALGGGWWTEGHRLPAP